MTKEAAYQIPKPLLHSVLSAVISGTIVAFLGFVGLSVIGWLTGGSLARWMGGVTELIEPTNFSTATAAPIPIPNISGAKFCALTSATIPAGGGQCYVSYDSKNKQWMYYNALGSNCYFACIK